MPAFPSTALLPQSRIRYVDFEAYTDGRLTDRTFKEEANLLKAVDHHASIFKSKGGPKYLPESYKLRTIVYAVQVSYVLECYNTHINQSYSRSLVGTVAVPTTWQWSSDALQAPDTIAKVRAKLFEKTISRLKQDQANLTVDVAESRQTLRLLRDLTNVKKAAERFKRMFSSRTAKRSKRQYTVVYDHEGRPTKQRRYFDVPGSPGSSKAEMAQKKAEYLRDQWMQARFGVRPLVGSIFDTMKALLNQRLTGKFKTTCTSRAISELHDVRGSGTGLNPFLRYNVYQDTRGIMISEWHFPTSPPTIQDFFSLNPLGIAWEAMPLSWIADYFVNVGQTLQNWEDWFRYNSAYVGGMTTVVTREVREVKIQGSTQNPIQYYPNGNPKDGVYHRSKTGYFGAHVTHKTRTVHASLPSPGGLTARVNLNSAKVLDLCSVISQTLKSTR